MTMIRDCFQPDQTRRATTQKSLSSRPYAWARMPALQHGELLAQREILEEEAPTRPHEAKQRSKGQGNESKHGQEL